MASLGSTNYLYRTGTPSTPKASDQIFDITKDNAVDKCKQLLAEINNNQSMGVQKDIFVRSGGQCYKVNNSINLSEFGKAEGLIKDLLKIIPDSTAFDITGLVEATGIRRTPKPSIKLDLHEHFNGILDPHEMVDTYFEGTTLDKKYEKCFDWLNTKYTNHGDVTYKILHDFKDPLDLAKKKQIVNRLLASKPGDVKITSSERAGKYIMPFEEVYKVRNAIKEGIINEKVEKITVSDIKAKYGESSAIYNNINSKRNEINSETIVHLGVSIPKSSLKGIIKNLLRSEYRDIIPFDKTNDPNDNKLTALIDETFAEFNNKIKVKKITELPGTFSDGIKDYFKSRILASLGKTEDQLSLPEKGTLNTLLISFKDKIDGLISDNIYPEICKKLKIPDSSTEPFINYLKQQTDENFNKISAISFVDMPGDISDITVSVNNALEEATIKKLSDQGVKYTELQGPPPESKKFDELCKKYGVEIFFLSATSLTKVEVTELDKKCENLKKEIIINPRVIGADFCGTEQSSDNVKGKIDNLEKVYDALYQAANTDIGHRKKIKDQKPVVLRIHIGEGYSKKSVLTPQQREEARKNIDAVLGKLEEMKRSGKLDGSVVVRLGHAAHASPQQIQRMIKLGVIAEGNVSSNKTTGSLVKRNEYPIIDHLLWGGLKGLHRDAGKDFVPSLVLGMDGGGIMDTSMLKENMEASGIIDRFTGKKYYMIPESRFDAIKDFVQDSDKSKITLAAGKGFVILDDENFKKESLDSLKSISEIRTFPKSTVSVPADSLTDLKFAELLTDTAKSKFTAPPPYVYVDIAKLKDYAPESNPTKPPRVNVCEVFLNDPAFKPEAQQELLSLLNESGRGKYMMALQSGEHKLNLEPADFSGGTIPGSVSSFTLTVAEKYKIPIDGELNRLIPDETMRGNLIHNTNVQLSFDDFNTEGQNLFTFEKLQKHNTGYMKTVLKDKEASSFQDIQIELIERKMGREQTPERLAKTIALIEKVLDEDLSKPNMEKILKILDEISKNAGFQDIKIELIERKMGQEATPQRLTKTLALIEKVLDEDLSEPNIEKIIKFLGEISKNVYSLPEWEPLKGNLNGKVGELLSKALPPIVNEGNVVTFFPT